MAERATIFQGIQVGVEQIPGTAVPANRRLNSVSIEPAINPEFNSFRPLGQKYRSMVILNREWATADIGGLADYSELPFLLDSLIGEATPAPLGGGIYERVYFSNPRGPDTVSTLTIQQGSSDRAHRMTHGLVTGLEVAFTRTGDGVELSGDAIARAIEDGITMTPNPTALTQKPILPKDISVFLDDTQATLGTTQLLRVLQATFRLTDRFGALWALNADEPSFVATVETEPTAQIELMMQADAAGMAPLVSARTADTSYIRIEALDDDGDHYATIDGAGQVSDISDFADEDGVFAITYTFDLVVPADWDRAFEIAVANSIDNLAS